jgi:hypothetical protein
VKTEMDAPFPPPVLRLLSGDATDEEIAAVLAAVMTRSRTADDDTKPTETVTTWAGPGSRHRSVRGVFIPGRDGWRTSSWPR